jgi:hypothetical protein
MAVNTNKDDEAPAELETPSGVLEAVEEPIFGGDAKSLVVTKDVNVHQLINEIDGRLGDPDKYHVVGHLEDDDNPVSEQNPLTLYVHGGADMRTVRGVVESHDKDPDYGLSDEDRRISELKSKLQSGEDLPAAELNELLRSIIR